MIGAALAQICVVIGCFDTSSSTLGTVLKKRSFAYKESPLQQPRVLCVDS